MSASMKSSLMSDLSVYIRRLRDVEDDLRINRYVIENGPASPERTIHLQEFDRMLRLIDGQLNELLIMPTVKVPEIPQASYSPYIPQPVPSVQSGPSVQKQEKDYNTLVSFMNKIEQNKDITNLYSAPLTTQQTDFLEVNKNTKIGQMLPELIAKYRGQTLFSDPSEFLRDFKLNHELPGWTDDEWKELTTKFVETIKSTPAEEKVPPVSPEILKEQLRNDLITTIQDSMQTLQAQGIEPKAHQVKQMLLSEIKGRLDNQSFKNDVEKKILNGINAGQYKSFLKEIMETLVLGTL